MTPFEFLMKDILTSLNHLILFIKYPLENHTSATV